MTDKLASKVALVTGGSSGIGLGIAKRFAHEGARVFITGRHQSQLDQAVASIGGDAAAIQADSSNLGDLDRVFSTIRDQTGRIDVLAVSAGVYEFGTLGDITEEHFDRTFNTDVRGLLFTVQKALSLLSKGSSVILTGSMCRSRALLPARCTMRQRPRYARSPVPGSSTSRGATSASTC